MSKCLCGSESAVKRFGTGFFACCRSKECSIETRVMTERDEVQRVWDIMISNMRQLNLTAVYVN